MRAQKRGKSTKPRSGSKNTRDEKNNEKMEDRRAKVSSSEKKEGQRILIVQSAPLERVVLRIVPVLLAKLQVNALLDDCSTKTSLKADIAAELELEDVQCKSVML